MYYANYAHYANYAIAIEVGSIHIILQGIPYICHNKTQINLPTDFLVLC